MGRWGGREGKEGKRLAPPWLRCIGEGMGSREGVIGGGSGKERARLPQSMEGEDGWLRRGRMHRIRIDVAREE